MLPARIEVTLMPNDDPRASQVPRWIVGLAAGERDILILPDRVVPYPYDSLESVFRHEVTHLALFSRAGGATLPRWFHEGVAMDVDERWNTAGRLRLLLEMLKSPGTADLTRLFESSTEPDAAQAYGLSAALVADLRRRHGDAVVGAIAARVAGGASFPRAFEAETGETPDAAAARAWTTYRRWSNWVPVVMNGTALWGVILALAVAAYAVRKRRRARWRREMALEDSTDERANLDG